MALTLAFLEGGSLFAAAGAMLLLWVQPQILDWSDVARVLGQCVALSLCCVVAFYYNDLYDLRIVRNFSEFISRLLQSFGVAFLLLAGFYSLFPETTFAQGPFVSSLLIVLGFLLPLRAISYSIMRCRPFVDRVLVLGTGTLARQLVEEIEARPNCRLAIAGMVDDETAAPEGAPVCRRVLGSLAALDTLVGSVRPDRIIVALAERRGRLPVRALLAARVRGVVVEDGVAVYERLSGKLALESVAPSNLVFSPDFKKSSLDLAAGRAISLVVALVGVVVCAPILLLIAAAIKLDSRGPALFVHERVGLYGKHFGLLKFRTMRPVVTETSAWAGDNSERITRVGKWLRKFRLDELPQFINILRGDMNLVGPRPHPVSNVVLFNERIPYYAIRDVVRPGVTGWAQIRYAYANNLEEEIEKMRYDLFYIKHLSIWLDLRIVVDSVKIVLFGRGAR